MLVTPSPAVKLPKALHLHKYSLLAKHGIFPTKYIAGLPKPSHAARLLAVYQRKPGVPTDNSGPDQPPAPTVSINFIENHVDGESMGLLSGADDERDVDMETISLSRTMDMIRIIDWEAGVVIYTSKNRDGFTSQPISKTNIDPENRQE